MRGRYRTIGEDAIRAFGILRKCSAGRTMNARVAYSARRPHEKIMAARPPAYWPLPGPEDCDFDAVALANGRDDGPGLEAAHEHAGRGTGASSAARGFGATRSHP